MNNEIEQIARQNDMSVEFVTWFFDEKKSGCGNVWFIMMAAMWEGWKAREGEVTALALTLEKSREASGCPAGVDLQDWVKQLAAENAYLIPKAASELSNAWVLHKYLIGIQAAIMYLDNGNKKAAQEWLYGTIAGPGFEFPDEVDDIDAWATHQMRGSISHPRALEIIKEETPATDRIVAGIKADAAAQLVSALKVIANSEQHNGDTVVCDFDTLISVASGALRDYYAKQLREGAE
ncbi:hypothetical protein A3N52_10255 [Klebsiella aerogenes]|uniref:hypothetical protein n=1 Tax=Klebsiella aerogenes TaxID=548 RepID=UPI0007B35AA1|nr:hypothetical protein [Klebsiella aerogenes]KZQ76112.1 hypothetical protein A3N52_10255 [Klebsiella aerogenes]